MTETEHPAEPSHSPDEPRGGFFLNVVPAGLYVLAVFYGGGLRGSAVPASALQLGDKALHALAFFGMQLTVYRALRYLSTTLTNERVAVLAFATASALGGLLELYQMALPHRSAEWLDWVADVAGAALGWWVVSWRNKKS
ncbi:MAG: VanZ family protein [Polyangiaceae bacterium]|nr:VanZ family protein [Polyangiaceae bacterium]